jgi:hypothetical protein
MKRIFETYRLNSDREDKLLLEQEMVVVVQIAFVPKTNTDVAHWLILVVKEVS